MNASLAILLGVCTSRQIAKSPKQSRASHFERGIANLELIALPAGYEGHNTKRVPLYPEYIILWHKEAVSQPESNRNTWH